MLSDETIPFLSIAATFTIVTYYSGIIYGIAATSLLLVVFMAFFISRVG
jgi:hypothetical protein